MGAERIVVVGAGFAGLTAALAAHEHGLEVVVLEKGERVGGAAAYSGGQVWVPANHVARRSGIGDDPAAAAEYVRALSADAPELRDEVLTAEWLELAPITAAWLEACGAVVWEVIPGFPDYHYPSYPGSAPEGRYLTPAPFDGSTLGAARSLLLPGPHFPSGVTYGELFAWGGQAVRRNWDHDLLRRRRAEDVLTFGQALIAGLMAAVVARGVEVVTTAQAVALETDDAGVCGVRVRRGAEVVTEPGAVLLAAGSYDWDLDAVERYSATPREHAGSVAPATLTGDALRLAHAVGADTVALPASTAARLPGFRFPPSGMPGDTGQRQCHEHGLPHAIVVDRHGRRFCDDSFPGAITKAVLEERAEDGTHLHLPMFMVWDEQHHDRYGLAEVAPGVPYPEGSVTSAPTLAELARRLGIDPDGLARTVARFNDHARHGEDPEFGRGEKAWTRRFKGDTTHAPNPNLGPIESPPFHGIRLRLQGTGIPAAGLRLTTGGRVVGVDGEPVPGLYAAGSCTAMTTSGTGYNSGFSLSRAMTAAFAAVHEVGGVDPRGASA